MTSYGQFCSIARANEVLRGRWTLLVVRELLSGSRRFNDICRGIPRISRTMLSERLQSLATAGVVTRRDGEQGPELLCCLFRFSHLALFTKLPQYERAERSPSRSSASAIDWTMTMAQYRAYGSTTPSD